MFLRHLSGKRAVLSLIRIANFVITFKASGNKFVFQWHYFFNLVNLMDATWRSNDTATNTTINMNTSSNKKIKVENKIKLKR